MMNPRERALQRQGTEAHMANPQDPADRQSTSKPAHGDERFTGPTRGRQEERKRASANETAGQADDPAADAKSPLEDTDWRDQSQGPSHPRDDSGNKKR
jgi:hypothetical protein